jgi:hypothetical protein
MARDPVADRRRARVQNAWPRQETVTCAPNGHFVYNYAPFPFHSGVLVRALVDVLVGIALFPIAQRPVTGQLAPRAVLLVHVVDSAGVALANADVAIVHGLTTTVANGVTDATGRRMLGVPVGGEYQLVVRRIGFQRADQFFRSDRDSIPLRIILRRSTAQLPAVNVTAAQDLKRKNYHVEADDIAASARPIIDGLDVLTKLRPDMISRVPGGMDKCGLSDVWVNGHHIVLAPINEALAIKTRQLRRVTKSGLASVPVNVQSVLSSIHPEHIAEINYADCKDFSVERAHARNAVFVSLKPGVAFEPGIGSYVIDAAALPSVDQSPSPTIATETPIPPAAHRTRVLGVFDESTGDPVPDAEVADSASGTFARTTATGTVSLIFLPEGTSTILVRKRGYADARIAVSISPRDSVPITLIFTKLK